MTPDLKEGKDAGVKRRDFLKVLGVAGAATSVVGCATGDVEKLIPYLVSPDNTVPGVSNHYATTCRECAAGCGLIVEVRDGRAGHVEAPTNPPLTTVSMDSETFIVLAFGRRPAAAMSDRITIEGDTELGRKVVDQLNMMI